jgi:hypothetical protein
MQPPNPYAPPNPYGAPQAVPYGQLGGPGGPFAAWPDGPDLAVQKEAPLPSICMKCGVNDAPNRRNQQFVWTPPWVFIFFLVSPIIGAIIAVIVQKKGRLHLPLCHACNSRWKNGILLLVLAIVGLIAGLILGGVALGNDLPELGVPLMISGFVALIAVAIMNRNRFLRVKKVDERMITLRQVHPNAAQVILNAAQGR